MAKNILFLAHVDESGTVLPKVAHEALGVAIELTEAVQGRLTIGLFGQSVQESANTVTATGARILVVSGTDLAYPRYGSDAAAAEAICKKAEPEIVIAPSTSRMQRIMAGVAQRLNGCVDAHITGIETTGESISVKRWFYRQRLEAVIQRDSRPWFLLMDSGCHEAWRGAAGDAHVEQTDVAAFEKRTNYSGIRVPNSDAQTIRPDAELLFVAGAGWCKKQSDGKTHLPEAEEAILTFLRNSGASLGGSKSLVDQSGENQAVLRFMTHLNQVGQTGSTPRHPKGLSTCCHGEEPHVVGWRFINERRAINLDPNCGWARGKADVLYVADAFEVMAKLNALLLEKANKKEELAAV
jgi:electron transfer flavoprotein alpha subunit